MVVQFKINKNGTFNVSSISFNIKNENYSYITFEPETKLSDCVGEKRQKEFETDTSQNTESVIIITN